MNKTKNYRHKLYFSTGVALLAFASNAWASDPIVERLNILYPNGIIDKTTGFGSTCQSCHVNEVPIPPIADSTLKPNFLEAYSADTVNLTGVVNLIQGCQAGSTADPVQPWVCVGGAPTPLPAPEPAPAPTPTIACDDATNTASCLKLVNQTGTLGNEDSGAAMTDTYVVRCGAKTTSLRVSVSDLAPDHPATISIQAIRGRNKSPVSTDAVDGDGAYSKPVRLAKGKGQYVVKIMKVGSDLLGAELYDAKIQCIGGKKAQTTVRIRQNQ
jgi:hypothetical protein